MLNEKKRAKICRNVFTQKFEKQIWSDLTNETKEMIKGQQWRIKITSEWVQLLEELIQTECQRLKPVWYFEEVKFTVPITKSIGHISFKNLKDLELNSNKIQNIEFLGYLDIENIKKVNLGINNITCLKVFAKIKWLRIKRLQLYDNPIQQLTVERSSMSHLEQIQSFTQEFSDRLYVQDPLKPLVKIVVPNIQAIFLPCSENVINSRHLVINLMKKFQHASIYSLVDSQQMLLEKQSFL